MIDAADDPRSQQVARDPWPLRVYTAAAASPLAGVAAAVVRCRAAFGKEDGARIGERFGRASQARPPGRLVWLHAVSVGEATSLLPLIAALRAARPDLATLLTTGTRTSAEAMARRAPRGVIHQFAPIDTSTAVRRFFDHWRPDVLAVVESEIWPMMLQEARRRRVRTAVVSARVSARSAARWGRAGATFSAILRGADLISAQTEEIAARFRELGCAAERVVVGGSLKLSAEPLPASAEDVSAWRARLAGRPLWLAASTHDGEEAAAFDAHAALASTRPGLLTIIAPRHPNRGDAVAAAAARFGYRVTRRSRGERPSAETDVHLVDVLGELGLWYRLAPAVFIGGSLVDKGGHNPLEPARLNAAVLMGPHRANCQSECAVLVAADALTLVDVPEALGSAVAPLLGPDGGATPACAAQAARGGAAAATAAGSVARTLELLEPLLPDVEVGCRSAEAGRGSA